MKAKIQKRNITLELVLITLLTMSGSVFAQDAALHFDGGENVATALAVMTETDNFTLEAWVKREQSLTYAWVVIDQSKRIGLGTTNNGQLNYIVNNSTGYAPVEIPLHVWTHIALVRRNGEYELYKDGVAQQTSQKGDPDSYNGNFNIGRASGEKWNGGIDEVRIWTIARTSEEIATYYGQEVESQEGLAGYYKMNEGVIEGSNESITELIDHSGNEKHATLYDFALTGMTSNYIAGRFSGTPLLTTTEPQTESNTSALLGGDVYHGGTDDVTTRGVCWNTTGVPTINDNIIPIGSGEGEFSEIIDSFMLGTTYYVRSYATNSMGTGYGNNIFFMIASPPENYDLVDGLSLVNAYEIATLENLYWLSINDGELNKHYKQTADINASSTNVWDSGKGFNPIGRSGAPFRGNYNGQGFSVDSLYINRPLENNQGFFGYAYQCTIENLGMTNVNINGRYNVGGLIGYHNNSIVNNCFSTGSIIGYYYVGGLVGRTYKSTINNSYSKGSTNGYNYVAGLVACNWTNSAINNCYSTGAVEAQSSTYGGLVANNSSSEINNSFWDMESSGQSYSAGGNGKTTVEMKTESTFTDAGWDFDVIWDMDGTTNDGYAFFQDYVVPNTAPIVENMAVTTTEDVAIEIILTGADIEGDAITFSVVSAPTNGAFTDNIYTPNINWFGEDSFTYQAFDGELYSEEATVIITVTGANDAPVIASISEQTMNEDESLDVVLSASDVDGDVLTYAVQTDTSAVPVTVSNDTLTLTPVANWNGNANITVIVSDGSLTDTTSFTLTVNAVNDAPVFTSTAVTEATEDVAYSYVATASDVDGDALTFTGTTVPTWMSFDASTTTLSGTPSNDEVGVHSVVLTVNDGTVDVTQEFTVTVVNVNDAPVIASISEQTMNEDESLDVVLSASDVDGDVLTYAVQTDTSAVPVTVSNDTLTLTPVANWNGNANITVIVSDGSLTDTTSFAVTVNAVNDAPSAFHLTETETELVIPLEELSTGSLDFGWEVAEDVDGDTILYHYSSTLTVGSYTEQMDSSVVDTGLSLMSYQDLYDKLFALEATTATVEWQVHSDDGTVSVPAVNGPLTLLIDISNLSVDDQLIPDVFALHQNYPNPFNPTTTLQYDLPEDSQVKIMIYDIMGREVKTLVHSQQTAGFKSIVWDATNDLGQPVSAGMYLYRISAGEFHSVNKMILLK